MFKHTHVLALVSPLLLATSVVAGTFEGTIFHDINGNGVQDPGESGLADQQLLFWRGAAQRFPGMTAPDGTFSIAADEGPHQVEYQVPEGWRLSLPDQSDCPAGADPIIGSRRYSSAQHLRMNFEKAEDFRYVSLGDSIAAGFNLCFVGGLPDYVSDVADDLAVLGGEIVVLENRAIPGWHSEDLLAEMYSGDPHEQYIPNVVAANPDLVTISIGGNDYLSVDGDVGQNRPFDPADLETMFTEVIELRKTVQEVLSTLTSELPMADIELNTVYDNLAHSCNTTDMHAAMVPMTNTVLKNLAWGQMRPVLVAEIQKDIAHQDVNRTSCCGAEDMICLSPLDLIHLTAEGGGVLRQALNETLGTTEVDAAGTTSGVNLGVQERVATIFPTVAEALGGQVVNPTAALALDGSGATVQPDASAAGWLDLSGFSLPDGITPSAIVVGARYRTTSALTDDEYRMAASVLDFAAPTFTFTGWDTQTPMMGGSGLSASGTGEASSVVNTLKDVPNWRDVSALLTLNASDDGTVTGSYAYPLPTAAHVSALKVRLTLSAVGALDGAGIELDAVWADVYGIRDGVGEPLPGEVSGPLATPLRVTKSDAAAVTISWADTEFATNYRLYHGDLTTRSFDAGVAENCSAALSGDLTIDGSSFFLVSGVNSAGEGPLGRDSEGSLRTVASATCP